MADKEQMSSNTPLPSELPSPEKLFHSPKSKSGQEKDSKRTITPDFPKFKIVKLTTTGLIFALFLIVLMAVAMKYEHIQLYCMESNSMERLIEPGSLVVVRPVKNLQDIKIDDVISFSTSTGMIVTHQVVAIEDDVQDGVAFRTQGTENEMVDAELVTANHIKGKVLFYIPYVGKMLKILP